ncbi:MAG: DUF1573 domain-containing protein [Bacteroidales bacterium]|nr:DUF1573 domain-containing protein [Bacteroidales bacterium]
MKKLLFTILLFLSLSCKAQNNDGAKIQFEEKTINLDTLYKGDKGIGYFYFLNTGNTPLILHDVLSSCGCTTPYWSKKPIMPQKKDKITISYNTDKIGPFQKTIIVKSNAINEPKVILRVKGIVLEKNN